MKIALITSWATDISGGSGTALFFQSLLRGLQGRGYDLDVIAPNFDVSDYFGVTMQRIAFNARLPYDARIRGADVVIGLDWDGYGLDPSQRPPMIASSHAVYGDILQWESGEVATMVKAQAYFDRLMMHNAEVITIGSAYAADRIAALYDVDRAKIEVIHHGMIAQEWLKLVDAEPKRPHDHPIILSVGKMYPRKRTDVLLRAVPLLLDKYPALEVRIAGDGLMWDEYHRTAAELGVMDHVTFLGHVSDDAAFAREWRMADVFCHPSSQETFGYVYLEAMSIGKPIVAVRAGAAPEVIADAGRLAEPENPAALAAELDFFLGNERARAEYGARGEQRAAMFTHDKMIDGYDRAIARAVSGRKRG